MLLLVRVGCARMAAGGNISLSQSWQLIIAQSAGSAEQILASSAVPDEEVTVPVCCTLSLPSLSGVDRRELYLCIHHSRLSSVPKPIFRDGLK